MFEKQTKFKTKNKKVKTVKISDIDKSYEYPL